MQVTEFLDAICAPGQFMPLGAGSLLGLFLAGLGGSVLHCVPMCGPFVLGQVSERMARVPAVRLCEMHRLKGALLVPYHLGRLATYAGLGAAVAALGAVVAAVPWFNRLSGLLLALAALLFLALAGRRLFPALARAVPGWDKVPPGAARLLATAARRWRGNKHGVGQGFLLGILLGFLPCGFLYAALAVAAAGRGPVSGALAMAVFGLGTIPALVGVGVLGHRAMALATQQSLGGFAAYLSPAVLLLNAGLLGYLSWQRLLD